MGLSPKTVVSRHVIRSSNLSFPAPTPQRRPSPPHKKDSYKECGRRGGGVKGSIETSTDNDNSAPSGKVQELALSGVCEFMIFVSSGRDSDKVRGPRTSRGKRTYQGSGSNLWELLLLRLTVSKTKPW